MIGKRSVMFHEALDRAIEAIRAHWDLLGPKVVVVRDLRGRLRVVLPEKTDKDLAPFVTDWTEKLGAYGYPAVSAVLFAEDLMEGEALFARDNPDRRLLVEEGDRRIWLLDRQLIGADWTRAVKAPESKVKRVTFYSIKGGVGRSTALALWAWWLARGGRHVLVFDVDLESPGVSSLLLPEEHLPEFGIVDWFVEDSVGQGDVVVDRMTAASPLALDLPGSIQVVPAYGTDTGDYLPKLARCYLEPAGTGGAHWADRLRRLTEALEEREEPDVVLLDSRAGIHDIAAVLIHRMDADALLFGVESSQTWRAYSFLFRHWRTHPLVRQFRTRFQMVAGMVPETNREVYIERFTERSWDLFRENLYDDEEPSNAHADNPEVFSFDLHEPDAPHYPLPIFWSRALQELEPAGPGGLDEQAVEGAMGQFLPEAERWLFGGEEDT